MSDGAPAFLVGDTPYVAAPRAARGALAEWRGRPGYRIDDLDALPPFLVSVVSAGDRWLYASSSGALVAGRRDPDGALFPYETDDRILARDGRSGGRTVVFVRRGAGAPEHRWEPLLRAADGQYAVSRSLWKSRLGDELVLEERNEHLGLVLRVSWSSGERFGFQRRVELENVGPDAAAVRLLDGLVDLQAADIERRMQEGLSCLVDAYRCAELDEESGLGLFRLSSIPVDQAVPSESLRASGAWVRGLPGARLLLSVDQLEAYRRGATPVEERATRGRPGALLAATTFTLAPGETRTWVFGADVGLDAAAAVHLACALGGRDAAPPRELEEDLELDRERLAALVTAADGDQRTAEPLHDARHASNVLFNVMRGGTFLDDGAVSAADFGRYLREVAPEVAARTALEGLPAAGRRGELVSWAEDTGDADVERLAREYLPLTFSRRHGDPSRPWNRFSIETHERSGAPRLRYEGNWRDIFQNWEALLSSYPAFVEAAIFKFLDCSTADGFNPYRVSREGVDWEVPDPADPWAYIGYWGDHQVVYLQRLLDLAERVAPGALARHLGRRVFVFTDVPYRLAGFDALRADPSETIRFDDEVEARTAERVASEGNEGRLLRDGAGRLVRASLAEKLLVPVLGKLAHLVPGVGIWMNTQRPEWNDANNALVGRGVSVVTTAQLHRHLITLARVLDAAAGPLELDAHIARHLDETRTALAGDPLAAAADPAERGRVLEALGRAGERYRAAVYAGELGGEPRARVARDELQAFLDLARGWLAATLAENERADGLWHAYNLLDPRADGAVGVRRLAPMLEGQVAALASGALDPRAALATLDALRSSALWREDLGTYLLYPDRELASFLEKGRAPRALLEHAPELKALLADERGTILRRDEQGGVRFAPGLANAATLGRRLDALAGDPTLGPLVAAHRAELLAAYEEAFDHAAFTGRSGTFFGYEGLGCVYWHMVSKLRLAIAEVVVACEGDADVDARIEDGLVRHYALVRRGLGVDGGPAAYGAVPTDPYSHTPAAGGARQPGMTGQVKEDILARGLELGLRVREGRVGFVRSALLADPTGAFSCCGVPVTTRVAESASVRVRFADGGARILPDGALDEESSAALLARDGRIAAIDVDLPR